MSSLRLVAILCLCLGATAATAADDPFGGLRLGIQSYSVRHLKDLDAVVLAVGQELKLKHIELYPGHLALNSSPEAIDAAKAKLASLGITPDAFGVVGFGKDAAANRKIFEFAKRLGLKSISADPAPESYANLDELCGEFQIAIAIHNHGPGHRYGTIAQLEKAFAGRHKLFGLCCDTGHFIRSGIDPLAACKQFKDRLFGMHLKDFKKDDKGKFTDCVAGEGSLDVDSIVRFLIENRYQGPLSIEYEGGAAVASVAKCMERVKAAVEKAAPAAK